MGRVVGERPSSKRVPSSEQNNCVFPVFTTNEAKEESVKRLLPKWAANLASGSSVFVWPSAPHVSPFFSFSPVR